MVIEIPIERRIKSVNEKVEELVKRSKLWTDILPAAKAKVLKLNDLDRYKRKMEQEICLRRNKLLNQQLQPEYSGWRDKLLELYFASLVPKAFAVLNEICPKLAYFIDNTEKVFYSFKLIALLNLFVK